MTVTQEYEAGLSLPLWLPGQRDARRDIADSIDSEAAGELRFLSWEVAGETLERAWALRLAGSEEAQSEPLNAAPVGRHPQLLTAMGWTDTTPAWTQDVRIGRRSAPVLTLYAKRDRGIEADPYNNSVGVKISLAFGSAAHAVSRIARVETALT